MSGLRAHSSWQGRIPVRRRDLLDYYVSNIALPLVRCWPPAVFVPAGLRVLTEVKGVLASTLRQMLRFPMCFTQSHEDELQLRCRDYRRIRPGKGRIRQATDLVIFLLIDYAATASGSDQRNASPVSHI